MKQKGLEWYQRFFKDAEGKVVLAQFPNMPLICWILFALLSQIKLFQDYSSGFSMLSKTFLFVWSYLELTEGVNYFRKVLGAVVMCALIVSFFL